MPRMASWNRLRHEMREEKEVTLRLFTSQLHFLAGDCSHFCRQIAVRSVAMRPSQGRDRQTHTRPYARPRTSRTLLANFSLALRTRQSEWEEPTAFLSFVSMARGQRYVLIYYTRIADTLPALFLQLPCM